jgi:hypothetical protein
MNVGMHRSYTSHTRPSPRQMLARQYEFAFKNVYEFRAFVGMERKSCAGLQSDDLHLQAVGNNNVFDKHSRGEG